MRRARCTPQFAFRNCHGSFPEFISGWTIAGMNLVWTPALTCFLSPGEDNAANGFWLAENCPANPVARIFEETADDSLSPPTGVGEERRGEVARGTKFRITQGQRGAGRGARGWAMTEI
jgi:hypothetical protein